MVISNRRITVMERLNSPSYTSYGIKLIGLAIINLRENIQLAEKVPLRYRFQNFRRVLKGITHVLQFFIVTISLRYYIKIF